MRRGRGNASASGGRIYTLAQNGTGEAQEFGADPAIIIRGNGTEIASTKVLYNRARRKIVSQRLSKALMQIAEEQEDPELKQTFRNTYYCQSKIYSVGNRLYGRYCKNRVCTICLAIRKAQLINKYYPELEKMHDLQFVTLTVPAVPKAGLAEAFRQVLDTFQTITEKHRKRSLRGTGPKLIGVKSLECCFNPVKRTYNPHLHILIAGKDNAEILVNDWLQAWNKLSYTSKHAQKIKPVRNLNNSLIEIIKYGTKIFTEPDLESKSNQRHNREVYAKALYNIVTCMKGLRIFERFGFNVSKAQLEHIPAKVATDFQTWKFLPQFRDWQNTENELTLTNYHVPEALINLLENEIDFEAQ